MALTPLELDAFTAGLAFKQADAHLKEVEKELQISPRRAREFVAQFTKKVKADPSLMELFMINEAIGAELRASILDDDNDVDLQHFFDFESFDRYLELANYIKAQYLREAYLDADGIKDDQHFKVYQLLFNDAFVTFLQSYLSRQSKDDFDLEMVTEVVDLLAEALLTNQIQDLSDETHQVFKDSADFYHFIVDYYYLD